MYRLDEASQAMRGIGAQVAGQSAKWQEAVDNLTTSLNSLQSRMVPDTSLLGTAAYSQVLHDLVNRNQALSSQVDNSIADITADLNKFSNQESNSRDK